MATGGTGGPSTLSVSTVAFGGKEAILHVLDGNTSGDDLSVVSSLTGSGRLTKSGNGTLTLLGNDVGLTGLVSVTEGTLKAAGAGALAAHNAVQVTAQGTLDLAGLALTVSQLGDGLPATPVPGSTLRGGIVTSATAAALTVGDAGNASSSFSGTLSGLVSLEKKGTGVLTLTGANTYTGTTHVSSGTLAVSASGTLSPSGDIQIDHGATLDFSGRSSTYALGATQTLTGSGRVVGGLGGAGTIAPGAGQAILTIDQIHAESGLDFAFDFTQTGSPAYGNAQASGNDLVRLTGAAPFTLALNGGNSVAVDVSALGSQLNGGAVLKGGFFATTDFSASIAGAAFTFTGMPANVSGFIVSVVPETAAFEDGTVNGYVTQFIAVPEPGSLTWLALGAAALGFRRRRRIQPAPGLALFVVERVAD